MKMYHGSPVNGIEKLNGIAFVTESHEVAETYLVSGKGTVYTVEVSTENFLKIEHSGVIYNRSVKVPEVLNDYIYGDTASSDEIVEAAAQAGFSGVDFGIMGDCGLNLKTEKVFDLGIWMEQAIFPESARVMAVISSENISIIGKEEY